LEGTRVSIEFICKSQEWSPRLPGSDSPGRPASRDAP
jgi:hypothetical protein